MRTRQTVPAIDVPSLLSLVGVIFYLAIFYLFYNILKRIERTLAEIKKLIETKPSTAS